VRYDRSSRSTCAETGLFRRQGRCERLSPEPTAQLLPQSGRCLGQEACGAHACGRHRLQLQSRTPRLAFCGPGFIALCLYLGTNGCPGLRGRRRRPSIRPPAAAFPCGADRGRPARPPLRCRALVRSGRCPTQPPPSPRSAAASPRTSVCGAAEPRRRDGHEAPCRALSNGRYSGTPTW
jgi:hypothetical protein